MVVKDIFIYPIKSVGGIRLNQARVMEEGFQYDRRMMLADENGKFISQREFPQLALIGSRFSEGGFSFFKKTKPDDEIFIPHDISLGDYKEVQVWEHLFQAAKIKSDIHSWFNNIIGMKSYIYKMGDKSTRYKELIKSPGQTKVSMADGYPYLVISEASLKDLNRRLIVPVGMDQFRPNIVISDSDPYQEESFDKIQIGEISFRMIKRSARCIIININQKTAKKLVEPLKTLSLYKKEDNNVHFGMNGIAIDSGIIKVGDIISEI